MHVCLRIFSAVWTKQHTKQGKDFSRTVKAGATKTHCAICLLTATTLQPVLATTGLLTLSFSLPPAYPSFSSASILVFTSFINSIIVLPLFVFWTLCCRNILQWLKSKANLISWQDFSQKLINFTHLPPGGQGGELKSVKMTYSSSKFSIIVKKKSISDGNYLVNATAAHTVVFVSAHKLSSIQLKLHMRSCIYYPIHTWC